MTAFSDETGREAPTPTRESENKYLGGRTDAELEASFANMYYGWERGLNITQERFGNGETKFTETPMTDMELAARYVAAEIGLNIFEIANKAAFAPIIVYSQIQARLGPLFERLAALSAAPVEPELISGAEMDAIEAAAIAGKPLTSTDRDLAERQLPQTFQDELKDLRLRVAPVDQEPVAKMTFTRAMDIAERGFKTWRSKPHNAKWFKRIDGTPIPNDLLVNIAEAFCHDEA